MKRQKGQNVHNATRIDRKSRDRQVQKVRVTRKNRTESPNCVWSEMKSKKPKDETEE